MKTILVPVDLTAAAEHTLVYANKLAVRLGAEIVLLYCHHDSDEPSPNFTDHQKRLQNLTERLRYVQLTRQDGRRIRYRYAVRNGCLHDHVQGVIDEYGAELVVMNLEHTDCGEESVNGNHAARIVRLASCPVLVVPPGNQPLPSRIVFLADFAHLESRTLPRLGELVRGLRAQLQLVHFYRDLKLGELVGIKRGMLQIKQVLAGVAIDSKLVLDDDPLEGIGEFCSNIQAQLLVFAPANASLLSRFFDVSYTKTHAYHTRIPVLVIRPQQQPDDAFCCQHCALQDTASETTPALASL
ncbi:universal stress protein [Hymenobacter koreensis]|uniref:UspA domain-containing protein n=1 Tax=Hymenobacter koreensis TaxID=1084523 RepID=A0ABP8JFF4_9BACT